MTTLSPSPCPDLLELQAVSARLESAPASEAVRWAWDRFGDGLVLAASFQDCVLIDIAASVAPEIEVVFLDTQYHFAETLEYVELVRARYDLNLRIETPAVERDDLWRTDTNACCEVRKVQPLARALEGKCGWMTGLRRADGPSRTATPIVVHDIGRDLVKVNPLAAWSDADVDGYARDRDLPVHPLAARGFRSIGCWPCTQPVADDDHPRAGRWQGTDKTECGLHV